MPSEKSSSADGKSSALEWRLLLVVVVPTTRPQNSNSGEDAELLWLCLGELGVLLAIDDDEKRRVL